jgi:hypothetical protein
VTLTHATWPGARTERFAGIIPAALARQNYGELLTLYVDVEIGAHLARRDCADDTLTGALAASWVEFSDFPLRAAGLLALARAAFAAELERPN